MPFNKKQKTGLKINNVNSSIKAPEDTKNKFETIADAKFEDIQEYKKELWSLSQTYKSFIKDTILEENKSPIVKELEKDTANKLMALATKINNDETQEEAMGSTALCMLLMKCLLIQRDQLNNLSYKLSKLEDKSIKKLE
jgi:hypothetical protein